MRDDSSQSTQQPDLRSRCPQKLIPQPRSIKISENYFTWSEKMVIVFEAGRDADAFSVDSFVNGCSERLIPVPRVVTREEFSNDEQSPHIIIGDPSFNFLLHEKMKTAGLSFSPDSMFDEYILYISPVTILVASSTDTGVFYGIQTLIQLLPEDGTCRIPCLIIHDWTDIQHRGISMDYARGVVDTTDIIKKNIERMAHYKMNVLMLYLEDAFFFPSHPDIGEDRDRLTLDECHELDAFAQKHHIKLIPILDSPAHLERLLKHPNYSYLREGNDNDHLKSVIDVMHPDTYPLLSDMYNDICDAFSSDIIYMGGDECFGLGKGKNKALSESVGAGLFLRHIKIIREILVNRGRRMAVWADQVEPDFFKAFGIVNYGLDALYQIPRDVIIAPWHYGSMNDFTFAEKLVECGFDMHLWSSFNNWDLYPYMNAAARNVETYIPFAHKYHALGIIHSSWKDCNSYNEYNWPQAIYFSEWAWNSRGRNLPKALPVALESFYGPGTGELSDVLIFLGDIDHYFGWGIQGIGSPGYRLFFDPLEPRLLSDDILILLQEFRARLSNALELFNRVSTKATRNRDHLDYIAFGLLQQEMLADLIYFRHLIAQNDTRSYQQSRRILLDIQNRFQSLIDRFKELWIRSTRPMSLETNMSRYLVLKQSIDNYLNDLPET